MKTLGISFVIAGVALLIFSFIEYKIQQVRYLPLGMLNSKNQYVLEPFHFISALLVGIGIIIWTTHLPKKKDY